jgi:PleD family two-component response regulator
MDVHHRRHQEPKLVVLIGNRQKALDHARSMRPQVRVPARRTEAPMGMQEFERQDADFTIPPPILDRQVKEILLVDPDTDSLRAAQRALRFLADVEVSSTFAAARARIVSNPPDLLVTNLRLRAYNGLHLVHTATARTRCIVYSNHDDLVLAREVQAAGAFYERSKRLPRVLAAYVRALLPPHDRRNLTMPDRRQLARGGRRCTDLEGV